MPLHPDFQAGLCLRCQATPFVSIVDVDIPIVKAAQIIRKLSFLWIFIGLSSQNKAHVFRIKTKLISIGLIQNVRGQEAGSF